MRCNPLSPGGHSPTSHYIITGRNKASNTSPYIAKEATNLTSKVFELFFKAIQFITNEGREGLPGTTNTVLKTLYQILAYISKHSRRTMYAKDLFNFIYDLLASVPEEVHKIRDQRTQNAYQRTKYALNYVQQAAAKLLKSALYFIAV